MIEKILDKVGYIKKKAAYDKISKEKYETESRFNAYISTLQAEKKLLGKDREDLKRQLDKLTQENRLLQNELDMLHKKYDGKFIVEQLPPAKLSRSDRQIMRISNKNAVRSKIARNTIKEIEKDVK